MELGRDSLGLGLILQVTLPGTAPKIFWFPQLYMHQMEGDGKEQAGYTNKTIFQ